MSKCSVHATATVMVVWGSFCCWSETAFAGARDEEKAALVGGNTEFALGLYAELRTESGNLMLSPYSVSTALAMTYAGARTETARQMADVLHFTLDQERVHPAFAALESSIHDASEGPGCTIHVANALWGQQGYGFLDEFLALNRRHYGGGFHELDFVHATEPARLEINGWVANKTQRIIRELLQRRDVDASTVLVLTNAIYFKGTWARQFEQEDTKDASFWISAEERVTVPMMTQTGPFGFASDEEVDVLEMPYAGERISMVLLLPKERDGLATVEKSLSRSNLDRWLGRLRPVDSVHVGLPRFKLEFRSDLARTLQAMGMTDAFGTGADFSGMTGRRDLFISKVIHQVHVDVNEEGTEAAAATAVVMTRGPRPTTFMADHPFLFLIRDKQTGSMLFMGRVVNPKK